MNSNLNEEKVKDEAYLFPRLKDKYVYLIAFFAGLIVLTIGSILFIGPFAVYTNAFSGNSIEEIIENFQKIIIEYQGVLMLMSEVVGIGYAVLVFRKVLVDDFKKIKKHYLRFILSVIGGMLAIYLLGELFEWLQIKLNIGGTSENQEVIETILTGKAKWFMILSVAVGAPVFEELIFRKFLYGYLSRTKLHIILNVAITTFVFAFIHCTSENFASWTAYFFLANYLCLSLSLTLPYVISKENIYASILVHMFNNILSLIVFYGVFNVAIW